MAWKEHFPVKPGTIKAPCRFGVSQSSKSGRCTAIVSITTATLQETLGWKKTDRFRLFVGEGEHSGRIQLEKSDAGSFKLGVMRGSWLLRLGSWAGLAGERHAMTPVEYQIQGKSLIMTLPAWAIGSSEPTGATSAPPWAGAGSGRDRADLVQRATPAQIRAAQAKVAAQPVGPIKKL